MNRDEIRVATIQFEPKQFEKERNVLELLRLVRRAGAGRLPVLIMRNRFWGSAVAALTGLAIRHRTYLAAGFVECDDQKKLYNTVVLVGPEGLTCFY